MVDIGEFKWGEPGKKTKKQQQRTNKEVWKCFQISTDPETHITIAILSNTNQHHAHQIVSYLHQISAFINIIIFLTFH
jgi:hypothetical protein